MDNKALPDDFSYNAVMDCIEEHKEKDLSPIGCTIFVGHRKIVIDESCMAYYYSFKDHKLVDRKIVEN